jgi:hypothetical protein
VGVAGQRATGHPGVELGAVVPHEDGLVCAHISSKTQATSPSHTARARDEDIGSLRGRGEARDLHIHQMSTREGDTNIPIQRGPGGSQ